MKIHLSPKVAVLACAVAALLSPAAAKADFVFHLDFNVTSLVNNASGPFYLDFLLTKGSGPTNTVTLSNFTFQGTGGGVLGSASTAGVGTATGNMGLGQPIVLSDTGAQGTSAELYQQFTATTTHVAFDVDTTQNLLGATPDGFFVSLLDNTASNIPTTDPNGSLGSNWTMVDLNVGGHNTLPDVVTFTSTAPSGATVATSVPEPSGVAALLGGVGVLLSFRRRRSSAAA